MSEPTHADGYAELDDDRSTPDGRGSAALRNGLVGGLAGVLLSFLPFSTVLGGAIAGYLEAGDDAAGVRVGGVAGAVAAVPYAVATWLALALEVDLPGPAVSTPVLLGGVAAFLAVYVLGASVVGGVLGSHLAQR